MRRSKTPQFKDLESSIIHAPSTTETTMQGVLAALPPTRYQAISRWGRSLPVVAEGGELLCVGGNLGLCVLALCFAFVALR
jgi:hypothetical protein